MKKPKKTCFSGISQKLLDIFSWLFLVPTEEFWRHLLELSELEKSENFPFKNRLTFFFLKKRQNKTCFSEKSQKLLNIFSWLFLVPTEEFWRHILELSELEKSENFLLKIRLTVFCCWKNKITKDFLYNFFIKGFPV